MQLAPAALAAQLLPGSVAGASLALAVPALAAQLGSDNLADGDVQLAAFSLAASAAGAGAGVLAEASLSLTLDGTAASGNVASASLTVPLLALAADGHFDSIGSAVLQLQTVHLDGQLAQQLDAPLVTGVVLNTRTRAVTTYAGLAPNSLGHFAGLTLMATNAGIVALAGDTDLGLPIAARVDGAVSDLGEDHLKRIVAGYVGYRAAGEIELTLIADGHHEYVYRLVPRRLDQPHASRVKFGRGAAGRYWQWKLANRGGAAFALDALSFSTDVLARRVR